MRGLTINDNWKDWKFGDTDAIMTFVATDDDQPADFSGRTLTFKIADTANAKQPKDYVASAPGYVDGTNVQLKTADVSTLTPGTYSVELWALDNQTQKTAIYPSQSYAFFTIEENTLRVSDIANVSSKTLEAIYGELVQRIGAIKQGAKGDDGKTPKLVIGTVTELASNQKPSVSIIPSADDPNTYTLNFQLPQGAQGKQGDPGLPGTPGGPGLNGSDGLTPKIDAKTKHWIIGNTDTGVVAEGQPGKDADPSKYVSVDQFTTLRQTVSDNSTQLQTLQGTSTQASTQLETLQDQVNTLQNSTDLADVKKQITDLQAAVKDLQDAAKKPDDKPTQPTTPKSDDPKSDQPAQPSDPASSATSGADKPASSASTAPTTPTSNQPAASSATEGD